MTVLICTCCPSTRAIGEPAILHAHDRPCEMHPGAPVVRYPPPLHLPGGEDCNGPTVTRAIAEALGCEPDGDSIYQAMLRPRSARQGGS